LLFRGGGVAARRAGFFILLGVNKSSIEDITKMNYIL